MYRFWSMIKILYISILFYVLMSQSVAQNFPYLNYTTKDGLPANYVYGVLEDSEGYIWAYTENGISKYDGYEWNNFTTKDGLIGNDVPIAFKSKCGELWFLSFEANSGVKVTDGTIISN